MLSENIKIFYEDKDVCIVEKPVGIPCEGDGETLPQILKGQLKSNIIPHRQPCGRNVLQRYSHPTCR